MPKQSRHYQIRKYVFCDLINDACTDEHDVSARLSPDCASCTIYNEWKESRLNISEYLKKQHENYLDEYVPGWRDDK